MGFYKWGNKWSDWVVRRKVGPGLSAGILWIAIRDGPEDARRRRTWNRGFNFLSLRTESYSYQRYSSSSTDCRLFGHFIHPGPSFIDLSLDYHLDWVEVQTLFMRAIPGVIGTFSKAG